MPWTLDKRDGQWCVVKVGETEPVPGGCHGTRGQAIQHQRALYANEARMASVYDELDARPVEIEEKPTVADRTQDLRIVVAQESALTAAAANALDAIAERLVQSERISESLVASLQALAAQPPPTVTVEAPQITVEAAPIPEVHVAAPNVTVEAAPIPPPAQVTVNPEIVLPQPVNPKKEVTFTRDRSGRLTGATVEED